MPPGPLPNFLKHRWAQMTSRLSPDAVQLVERNSWQLERKEFAELKEWILEYLKRRPERRFGIPR